MQAVTFLGFCAKYYKNYGILKFFLTQDLVIDIYIYMQLENSECYFSPVFSFEPIQTL